MGFVNTKVKYSKAIDILIHHSGKPYHDKIKEGIIRALAVPEARGRAVHSLIKEFNNTPREKQNLRWAIGNTAYTTITEDDIEIMLPLVLVKENGTTRDS